MPLEISDLLIVVGLITLLMLVILLFGRRKLARFLKEMGQGSGRLCKGLWGEEKVEERRLAAEALMDARDFMPETASVDPQPGPVASIQEVIAQLQKGFEPDLVYVPAGEFWMGSGDAEKDAYADEMPRHKLALAEYWIGRYPVLVGEFCVFVEQTGYRTHREKENSDYTWRTPRGKGSSLDGKERHPVTQLTWYDALAYCAWLSKVTGKNYCLPSEPEWEKAARWTNGRIYPWGNHYEAARCNTQESEIHDTSPVGQFSPLGDSAYGCADMVGNVWEWTRSLWGEKWQRPEGAYPYNTRDPLRENLKAGDGVPRVLRGGSWKNNCRDARCAIRGWYLPQKRNSTIGFRVVLLEDSTNK